MEIPEAPKKHELEENPLILPVSITMSILAVMVASVTLLGHRAHTEELLLQARASDQWAFYQAKNIRRHEDQETADILGSLVQQDKEKAEVAREKYLKEGERYEADKDKISDQAKELEGERDLYSRRADRFDGGEGLLEVALVICSITMLTDRRFFWYSGILIGAAGVILAITGLFLH